jgi:primosomal protein N' (replication factor Y)
VPKPYTYLVPDHLLKDIQIGIRVEVQFGRNKLYSALVIELLEEVPDQVRPKPILSIIDSEPVVFEEQIKTWKWIASY